MQPMQRLLRVLMVLCALLAFAHASSHSEAPGTSKQPQADATDFYFFRSYETGRDDRVVFILNTHPLQDPYAGPNYFALSDAHFYEIYVDINGDAEEDITFQFMYGASLANTSQTNHTLYSDQTCPDPEPVYTVQNKGLTLNINGNIQAVPLKFLGPITAGADTTGVLNWNEYYSVNVILGSRDNASIGQLSQGEQTVFTKPFDYAGTKSFPDYADYAAQYMYREVSFPIPGCDATGSVFIGQRQESFSVNLGGIFDLINFNPILELGGLQDNKGFNPLATKNVASMVLEVPISCLTTGGTDVLGAWTGVRQLLHVDDDHVAGQQVSRLGHPLVNEVVIGLIDKGDFNAAEPKNDATSEFATYVLYPTLPEIINILFLSTVQTALNAPDLESIAPNNFPRFDLVAAFLTGFTGLNKVTGSTVLAEILRLNTSIPPTAQALQNHYGVIGGDAAGFPNGRRPGDDVIDIALMVMMGKLCTVPSLFGDTQCTAANAPAGPFTIVDGAPQNAGQFGAAFPFLNTPLPGYVTGESFGASSALVPSLMMSLISLFQWALSAF